MQAGPDPLQLSPQPSCTASARASSAEWTALASSLAASFAESWPSSSAAGATAALLGGARFLSLGVGLERGLLLRSENLVAGCPSLSICLQPAGTLAALLAPGAGVHQASAWCAPLASCQRRSGVEGGVLVSTHCWVQRQGTRRPTQARG